MEKIKNESQIFSIFKGLIIAILFTLVALSLFSVLLVCTDLGEETIEPVILVVTAVSILIGSSIGLRRVKSRGLLKGGLIGFLYVVAIYIASSLASCNFSVNGMSVIMTICGIAGGIIGGIIGINTGK